MQVISKCAFISLVHEYFLFHYDTNDRFLLQRYLYVAPFFQYLFNPCGIVGFANYIREKTNFSLLREEIEH